MWGMSPDTRCFERHSQSSRNSSGPSRYRTPVSRLVVTLMVKLFCATFDVVVVALMRIHVFQELALLCLS